MLVQYLEMAHSRQNNHNVFAKCDMNYIAPMRLGQCHKIMNHKTIKPQNPCASHDDKAKSAPGASKRHGHDQKVSQISPPPKGVWNDMASFQSPLPAEKIQATGHPKTLRGLGISSMASMASLQMNCCGFLFARLLFLAWHGLRNSEKLELPHMCVTWETRHKCRRRN